MNTANIDHRQMGLNKKNLIVKTDQSEVFSTRLRDLDARRRLR